MGGPVLLRAHERRRTDRRHRSSGGVAGLYAAIAECGCGDHHAQSHRPQQCGRGRRQVHPGGWTPHHRAPGDDGRRIAVRPDSRIPRQYEWNHARAEHHHALESGRPQDRPLRRSGTGTVDRRPTRRPAVARHPFHSRGRLLYDLPGSRGGLCEGVETQDRDSHALSHGVGRSRANRRAARFGRAVFPGRLQARQCRRQRRHSAGGHGGVGDGARRRHR